VGVTGDGVNDAPALKSAEIGIAMGSGSEVAMEASQLVLLDNNFASILVAIENGRLVFDNLRKVVLYLLPGGCFAELIPVLMSIFLGVSQDVSSFEMLIVSLFTDISPSLSMMMEKPEEDLLKRPPRSRDQHLVDWRFLVHAYLFLGLMIVLSSQFMFFLYMFVYAGLRPNQIFFSFESLYIAYNESNFERLNDTRDMTDANNVGGLVAEFYKTGQTVTFLTIVYCQIFANLMCTRTHVKSFFVQRPWSRATRNLYLFAAELVSFSIMTFIIFTPFVQNLFGTRNLPLQFFFLPLICCVGIFTADELRKLCVRRKFLFFHKVAW
jgi:sodium/potassium-transporting ATPase subunit alpha